MKNSIKLLKSIALLFIFLSFAFCSKEAQIDIKEKSLYVTVNNKTDIAKEYRVYYECVGCVNDGERDICETKENSVRVIVSPNQSKTEKTFIQCSSFHRGSEGQINPPCHKYKSCKVLRLSEK